MHTQDLETGANLAGTVATRWYSSIEKLGRIMLIVVFMMSPGNKH